MKKLFALLLAVLMLSACGSEPSEIPPEIPENLPEEEKISDEKPEETIEPEQPSENQKGPEDWYAEYFSFEVPEFPDADTSKLPLTDVSGWCLEGTDIISTTLVDQYFCDHPEAEEIAKAIALAAGYSVNKHAEFKDYMDISEADNDYLLYSALRQTPYILFGERSFHYKINGPENSDNVVAMAIEYVYEKTGLQVIDAFYAEDVEATFHYLFGDETEFVPENLELFGHPYIPSAGIFLNFFEWYIGPSYPQVLSLNELDGKYYVEIVWTDFYYDYEYTEEAPENSVEGPGYSGTRFITEGGKNFMGDEISVDAILERDRMNFILEKENGRFIICGEYR